jgi:hypothetical protein
VPTWLEWWKELADALQATATTLGILIGAGWGLWLFYHRRERYPHINVDHQVSHWRIGEYILIHVVVRITNVGVAIVRFRSAKAWAERLVPPPDHVAAAISRNEDPVADGASEISWELAADVIRTCDWSNAPREIEPGEKDEYIFDFVVPREVELIQVYSHFRNLAKRGDIGWNTSTVYPVAGELSDGKDPPIRPTARDRQNRLRNRPRESRELE